VLTRYQLYTREAGSLEICRFADFEPFVWSIFILFHAWFKKACKVFKKINNRSFFWLKINQRLTILEAA